MSASYGRYLVPLFGLGLGLTLGLVYTWVIAPVEPVNTYPALLRTEYRRDWVRLAALSCAADGDLERARARLDGLLQEDVSDVMEALIEEYAAAGRPADTLRRLATLAQILEVHTPAMSVYLYTPTAASVSGYTGTPLPTPTLTVPALATTQADRPSPQSPLSISTLPSLATGTPTRTPHPPTPTHVPTPSFRLSRREKVCSSDSPPYIEVVVIDEDGEGLSGVEVWLTWAGGADRAVTGLKPRNGAGFADFNVEEGESYAISIGELGVPLVSNLRVEPCSLDELGDNDSDDEGGALMGSWRIVLGESG